MAMALGDILEIIDYQEYLGEQILNTYYYQVTGLESTPPTDPYFTVFGAFRSDVLEFVRAIQPTILEHTVVQIKNLQNGVDFGNYGVGAFGTRVATEDAVLPSYVSFGFLLRRSSLTTRNGYKRIAGVLDSDVSGNEYVGDIGQMNIVAGVLGGPITGGTGFSAAPVILKRPIDPPFGVTEPLLSVVSGASFRGLGTQNSRKPSN